MPATNAGMTILFARPQGSSPDFALEPSSARLRQLEREGSRAGNGQIVLAASMLAVCSFVMGGNAHAQSRKPTAQEVAAIRGCATKYQDDLDAGEENCLFKLVADPCGGPPGSKDGATVADC